VTGSEGVTPPGAKPPEALDQARERAALVVEDFEQDFAKSLAPFVERPRLAKRLLNLYRLARLAAAEDDLAKFAGGADANGYRATLTLLAMIVRHPEVAGAMVRELRRSDRTQSFDDLLERFEAAPLKGSWNERHRMEASEIRRKVRLIPNAPAGVGDYATWAPLVVRFSYHGLASPDLSAHSRHAAVAPSEAAG
jgi:hypothetical protein